MKKLFLTAILAASALLGSGGLVRGANYQFIASGTTVYWLTGTYSSTDWNQNAPWNGQPTIGQGPAAGDTLNLAASSTTGNIYLTNGGNDVFRNYSIGKLEVNADAGTVLQQLRGASSMRANLDAGLIEVSDGASLRLFRGQANARMLVSASNATISAGSTLYIGGSMTDSSVENALDGFQVSGTTIVSGTLSLHFQNRQAIGQFKFGDLVVENTGSVILANFISVVNTDNTTLNYEARSLSGSGKIYGLGSNANSSTLVTNLNLVTSNATDASFSGGIFNIATDGLYGKKVVALTVSGSGRQTLTGSNGYTGATTLSGGTLILAENGSINATSGITINGGGLVQNSSKALTAPVIWQAGRVGGLGTITGNLTATGDGTKLLTPGDGGIGTLTVTGALSLDANTTVQFNLNGLTAGVGYNVLSVGGAFNLNDAVLELNLGFAAGVKDEFTIARFGSRSGRFAGLVDQSLFNVGNYTFQIHYNTGDVTLQVVAVPEPRTAGLLALAVLTAGVGLSQRRRQSGVKAS